MRDFASADTNLEPVYVPLKVSPLGSCAIHCIIQQVLVPLADSALSAESQVLHFLHRYPCCCSCFTFFSTFPEWQFQIEPSQEVSASVIVFDRRYTMQVGLTQEVGVKAMPSLSSKRDYYKKLPVLRLPL